ncbi:potassium channel family protein [Actinomyces timonensis]|uniref:Potassium channel family protein n=1 Tax=Actinomyces timonensis TaxID=1288391 RepID=A0AAU8N0Y4_9ACTO
MGKQRDGERLRAWEVLGRLHGGQRQLAEAAMNLIWLAFAADYVVSLAIAPRRLRWFSTHLVDLAVVILPLLRPLRLLRLIALIRVIQQGTGGALRGRITSYAVGAVCLLTLVAALAVLDVERGAEGATITTFGNAVWWSLATITTVGYGDLAPVTTTGRWVAGLLMVGGIALIGLVTATLASWIVSLVAEETEEQETATREQVEALHREVSRLTARLDLLTQQGPTGGPGERPEHS